MRFLATGGTGGVREQRCHAYGLWKFSASSGTSVWTTRSPWNAANTAARHGSASSISGRLPPARTSSFSAPESGRRRGSAYAATSLRRASAYDGQWRSSSRSMMTAVVAASGGSGASSVA